jgi:undecaprenyl-diphosphatase
VQVGQAPPTPAAGGIGLLAAALAAGLITLLIAGATTTYDSVKEGDGLAQIDQPVLTWMGAHRTRALDTAVTAFTNIGGPTLLPIIATIVTVLLAWRWHSWTPIAFMVVATAGSLAITAAGKDLAARVRPPQSLAVPPFESSPSFPSGHTLNSTVIAIVLSYLVVLHVPRRRARTAVIIGLGVYAVLMGLSRVFLGQHWFTDVIAGWVAGAAWAVALLFAHRLLLVVQQRRRTEHQLRAGRPAAPVEPADER